MTFPGTLSWQRAQTGLDKNTITDIKKASDSADPVLSHAVV